MVKFVLLTLKYVVGLPLIITEKRVGKYIEKNFMGFNIFLAPCLGATS